MNFYDFYNSNKNELVLEFFREVQDAVRHIDHLEENVITFGKDGVKKTLDYIENIIEYFVGSTHYKISTKFDGAPAIVAGKDNNGNFFVSSKSAFAKSPKINYTEQDIDKNHGDSPGLANKLKIALKYLPELDLKGIYQMDYMFDDEIKKVEKPGSIDGVPNSNKFITFEPNTIKYTVTPDSPYGKQITNAKLGVAIHIEYQVVDGVLRVKKYTSSPNEFKSTPSVFVFNTLFDKPFNSKNNITDALLKDVQTKKKFINKLAEKVDFPTLTPFANQLKTYINKEVAQGEFLINPTVSAETFISYIDNMLQKQIEGLKTEKGKLKKQETKEETLKTLKDYKKHIINIFLITREVANIKNNFIKMFNEINKTSNLGQYFADENGNWVSAAPEGYAISRIDGKGPDIAKLVDRSQFSKMNFQQSKFR